MPSSTSTLMLTLDERHTLETYARSRAGRADLAQRARAVLMLADGAAYTDVTEAVGWSSATIAKWKTRFETDRLAGLWGRHRGSKPRLRTPHMEARILSWTRKPPPHGATHWSTRSLAKQLGVPHTLVQRVWQRAGLQPHRIERYMRSNDPAFESKAAAIIGLYLNPPQHAAVFCIDEKAHIQALDRLDPVLPMSPGRAERHGFEYYRHGTVSLYAALDPRTGTVLGQTTEHHTSAEFVQFLTTVVATQPAHREIHIILDNFAAHKTKQVQAFLVAHPAVRMHFTPTYSSWLNQVELWFAKIERDVIARGVFTSKKDLARKIRRYIDRYNTAAKPFRWTYADPTKRIA